MATDKDFLGVRRMENGEPKEYVWESNNSVKRRVENYAKGLRKLGLGRQEALGVYGVNRPEWVNENSAYFCYTRTREFSNMCHFFFC